MAIITTPVERIAYKSLMVVGVLVAPEGSEQALCSASVTGSVTYYRGSSALRVVLGEERYGREFFDYLPEPVNLVVMGDLFIEADVPVDSVREKVRHISLLGTIHAPASVVPLIQALTPEKLGEIAGADRPRGSSPLSGLTGKAAEMDGAPGFRVFYDRHRDAIVRLPPRQRGQPRRSPGPAARHLHSGLGPAGRGGGHGRKRAAGLVAGRCSQRHHRPVPATVGAPCSAAGGDGRAPCGRSRPEEATDARAGLAAACDAVAALPGSLREPLLLSTVGGLTSADVGATLGIPAGTVRYRVAKARLKLTNLLAANGQGGCDDQSSR